jgi:hypothetical protein
MCVFFEKNQRKKEYIYMCFLNEKKEIVYMCFFGKKVGEKNKEIIYKRFCGKRRKERFIFIFLTKKKVRMN